MRRTAIALVLIFAPTLAYAPPETGPSNYHFEITASPAAPMLLQECSKLGTQHEIIEQKIQTKTGYATLKTPGDLKVVNIQCKRGLTTNKDLDLWRKDVEASKSYKRAGAIRVLDYAGSEVALFEFTGAWPSELYVEKSEDGAVLWESFSLAVDTIVRK